jgi:uncharacterized protein YbjT (DUF2867 family)
MRLVAGATGILGSEICRQLSERGPPIRALVRTTSAPDTVARLRSYGAEVVEGDLKDRASLDRACQGVDAVITTVATTFSRQADDSIQATDREGQMQLIDAARDAGVRHFVYTSVSGGFEGGSFMAARRAVERHLVDSGITYTILRPGPFVEIWLSPHPAIGFDYPQARARVFGSGDGKVGWVSLGDVARFAVEALENPAGRDAIIELGPDWLSHLEIIRIFEEVGGRPFDVDHVSDDAIAQQLDAPDEYAQTFGHLMRGLAEGTSRPLDDGEPARAFALRLASVRDYAQRVLLADTTAPDGTAVARSAVPS